MTKDFAGRARTGSRKTKKAKPKKRVSAAQRVLFHGPSFACGALVGAAIVILAAYGPEYLDSQDVGTAANSATEQVQPKPKFEFEFPDLLKKNGVQPNPEPYAVPESAAPDVPREIMLQAASFRDRTDAEQLRATLLLENLPASTQALTIKGQRWYRVRVGPFDRDATAQQALVRLNEMGLAATKTVTQN